MATKSLILSIAVLCSIALALGDTVCQTSTGPTYSHPGQVCARYSSNGYTVSAIQAVSTAMQNLASVGTDSSSYASFKYYYVCNTTGCNTGSASAGVAPTAWPTTCYTGYAGAAYVAQSNDPDDIAVISKSIELTNADNLQCATWVYGNTVYAAAVSQATCNSMKNLTSVFQSASCCSGTNCNMPTTVPTGFLKCYYSLSGETGITINPTSSSSCASFSLNGAAAYGAVPQSQCSTSGVTCCSTDMCNDPSNPQPEHGAAAHTMLSFAVALIAVIAIALSAF
eukprot:TRINITY_DN440_c0_g1_i1.p1 TRINITY_DN440_c0_g1~~TRINITY_DN440_c0_g1_i1.p1  ORF type:complete len:282 (-),score=84.74 TRINITY_DN440_c0_g1_i1:74-919(-)